MKRCVKHMQSITSLFVSLILVHSRVVYKCKVQLKKPLNTIQGVILKLELSKATKRKVILVLIILITRTVLLIGQNRIPLIDTRPLNSISINLLGDASLISINYERQFLITPTFILSSKIGLGYNVEFQFCWSGPCSTAPDRYLTIPHHITGNFGKGKHLFELGLGGTVINGNTTQPYFFYPIVGYRFLPLNPGEVNFRIFGQIPFSGLETDDIIFVPFGLSLGTSF